MYKYFVYAQGQTIKTNSYADAMREYDRLKQTGKRPVFYGLRMAAKSPEVAVA